MSNCSITSPIPLGCKSTAGIVSIYVGDWNGTAQVVGLSASGEITSFTGSTVSYYEIQQNTAVASFVSKSIVSVENGTAYNEMTLIFSIQTMNQAAQNTLAALMAGRQRVIILDNEGLYWFMGLINGCNVSDGSNGTGKAFGDLYGSQITLLAQEPLPAPQVTTEAALSVIVPAVYLG